MKKFILLAPAFALFTHLVANAQEPVSAETARSVDLFEIELPDADAYQPYFVDTLVAPTVIAFGSCNKLSYPQTIWPHIIANSPQLWIWLGDIVYADTTDLRALAAHYKKLKTLPDYKKLRKNTQIIGIYDDHDYGINDGYKNHPTKRGAKKVLMDFLDVPMKSAVRKREGAYNSYTFGKGDQSIKIILLDTRYFRDALAKDPTKQRRYLPNTEGDLLGPAQWAWLENELRNSKANLNILCSSIQVISDEHPHEKWANFPNQRKKLLALISQIKPINLLILSGDRHMVDVSKMQLEGLPYPLYDITSSGLTHTRTTEVEPNRYRVGEMIVKRNFGLLKISWKGDRPTVLFQARGAQNEVLEEIMLKY